MNTQKSDTHINKFIPYITPLLSTSPITIKTKEIMSQAWGFNKIIHHNPAPNPISLDKTHLDFLEANLTEFVVAEKSDGVRYQLVLGTCDRKGFAVMVNRKMQMFEVPVYASADYFKGSVFDGELVIEKIQNEQERQVYLVFDLISIKGESKRNDTILKRYYEYTRIFDLDGKDILQMDIDKWEKFAFEMAGTKEKIVCLGNRLALQFRPKPFVTLINLGSLWRSLNGVTHKTDGLIIPRTTTPVGTGTDHSIFKWKQHHTIDLIIEAKFSKGVWNYQISFQNNDKLVNSNEHGFTIDGKVYYLSIKNNTILQLTSNYFGETHKNTFKLLGEFYCEFDKQNPIVWCSLERWRRDKLTANNANVIEKSLQNVKDNVSIEELLSLTTKHMYKITS